MEAYALFLNDAGRLRSGWRLGIFVLIYATLLFLAAQLIRIGYYVALLLNLSPSQFVQDLVFRLMLLTAAIFAGWICNRWLEDLPWRALGLWFHFNWLRDFLIGSLIGGASLAIAVAIAFLLGGLSFTLSTKEVMAKVDYGLATTAVLFVLAALAEEATFRGYPLQTLTRAQLAWFGVIVTSVPFAAIHLRNPNVAAGFTFINTALAGVWLALAYLRTRSLWFPIGVHWAWNWAQGSIFGGPVSGITVTNNPLLREFDKGPAWLTGGGYGIEGGLACTIAIVISTLFIWRTRLVNATPEMKRLTSDENPVARTGYVSRLPSRSEDVERKVQTRSYL
jgi:uncharacterized protein